MKYLVLFVLDITAFLVVMPWKAMQDPTNNLTVIANAIPQLIIIVSIFFGLIAAMMSWDLYDKHLRKGGS